MKSKKYKNIIYFQNGSIGDFLMTIFFLENVYLNNSDLKLWVLIPKNEKLLQQFLEKYPYINIIFANKRSIRGLIGIFSLLKFVFSKNLVITAPTLGKLSIFIKIMAKKMSFLRGSELVGFEDGQKINKFIYTKLLKYDTKIIYSDFLKSVIKELGFDIKNETPELRYIKEENILEELNLKENKYIIFSPIAATKGRSLKECDINKIIDFVTDLFPEIKIVLTGGKVDEEILSTFTDKASVLINPEISKLCTLLDHSRLFIGMDTGTSHIASFLQTKSLIIAQNGTPNWLPYYNENADILYSVNGCTHNKYEGREHLESCRGDILRCLGDVPFKAIESKLTDLLK